MSAGGPLDGVRAIAAVGCLLDVTIVQNATRRFRARPASSCGVLRARVRRVELLRGMTGSACSGLRAGGRSPGGSDQSWNTEGRGGVLDGMARQGAAP